MTFSTLPVKLSRIQLRNVRAVREMDLNLTGPSDEPQRLTLFVGKNGTCKTTLLRALAIGLSDPAGAAALIEEPTGGFVGSEGNAGTIRLSLTNGAQQDPLVVTRSLRRDNGREWLNGEWHGDDSDGLDQFFVYQPGASPTPLRFAVGYGAGRFGPSISPDSGRAYRVSDSVATLFRYDRALFGPEVVLRRLRDFLRKGPYSAWTRGIHRVLGLTNDDEIRIRDGGGVIVEGPSVGGQIPLEAWADGYRLTLNWLLDLYGWAMRAGAIDEEGHVSGILLIDEIEQHLHPTLQAEILPRLSELFPKMQIFATTHSPLVVLDAKPEQVVVLRREGNEVVADQHVPDFRGYSAEDVLTDPRLFDTPAYNLETQEKLAEYRSLASIPPEERSRGERYRLLSLANEVRDGSRSSEEETETARLLKQLIVKHGL